ncbi:hypothetical protein KLP28_07185 [Nocardioidaceae bacterium]|nr:hypothetical protein KLP28_07185 [Nocardioidaceae bacterium]
MATPDPDRVHDYSFDPVLAARFVNRLAVGLGLVLLVVVALTVVLDIGPALVSAVALFVGVGTVTGSHLVRRRPWVVRVDDRGYQVRFVRSAGVKVAPWRDVADVGVQRIQGEPCVVLGLRDGRRTIIPAALLSPGPETLLADIEDRLVDRR